MVAVVEAGQFAGDPSSFVVFVVGVIADDAFAALAIGPQRFRLAAQIAFDDGVRSIEDHLAAAIVLFEQHDRGVGERLFEFQDVADVGPAESVHRLVRVTDHAHVAMLARQQQDEFVLDRVGVLVLVDEHVTEPSAVVVADVGLLGQQFDGHPEEIVEVHRAGLAEAELVLVVDVRELSLGGGVRPLAIGRRRHHLVLGRRDGGVHRPRWEPLGVEVQVPQHVAGQTARRRPGRRW